ncbi:MAG: phosphohexomutase domain-containing protein [Gammaproteobacteria bacterium]
MSGIKFGTSGLRAHNSLLTDKVCYEFATAFLQHLKTTNKIAEASLVVIAGDYRANTDHILNVIAKAITDLGYIAEYVGKIPTPALAYYSQINQAPGIMVTGSHIPADMNGIKFYTQDGEITKADEKGILSQIASIDTHLFDETGSLQESDLPSLPLTFEAINAFTNRYLTFFPENALADMRVGIYKHSSVAADILGDVLHKLGAEVIIFGETEHFYSVDTESLTLSDKQIVSHHITVDNLDVVVSTDGDADRPLLSDENGQWIHGDILGLLTAIILSAKYVVTPISSNASVERVNLFKQVIRTKIGSPFVIEKMEELKLKDPSSIIGYEANGGVLLGSNFKMDSRELLALPTRDSFIPILSILSYVNQHKIKLSELVKKYSLSFTDSSSIKGIAIEKTNELFSLLAENSNVEHNLQKFFNLNQTIEKVDYTDGLRAYLADNSVIHLRGSGNAPELRCYTEATTKTQATALNEHVMTKIRAWS